MKFRISCILNNAERILTFQYEGRLLHDCKIRTVSKSWKLEIVEVEVTSYSVEEEEM